MLRRLRDPESHVASTDPLQRHSEDDPMPEELVAALEDLRAEIRLGEGSRVRLSRPIKGARRVSFPSRRPGEVQSRIVFTRDGRAGYARALTEVTYADLVLCHPMRDFSRRRGQSNKPVAYFSRTVGDLVGCESQHERRFALLADWRTEIVHIAAQPFTIDFADGCEFDSHTPDFVLVTTDGQMIAVDVKWPTREFDEKDVRRHRLVREQLALASIHHEVWFDAPLVLTENLANFAGARIPAHLFDGLAPRVLRLARTDMTVGSLRDLVVATEIATSMVALVVIRRLLWEQKLHLDMTTPFSMDQRLR